MNSISDNKLIDNKIKELSMILLIHFSLLPEMSNAKPIREASTSQVYQDHNNKQLNSDNLENTILNKVIDTHKSLVDWLKEFIKQKGLSPEWLCTTFSNYKSKLSPAKVPSKPNQSNTSHSSHSPKAKNPSRSKSKGECSSNRLSPPTDSAQSIVNHIYVQQPISNIYCYNNYEASNHTHTEINQQDQMNQSCDSMSDCSDHAMHGNSCSLLQ